MQPWQQAQRMAQQANQAAQQQMQQAQRMAQQQMMVQQQQWQRRQRQKGLHMQPIPRRRSGVGSVLRTLIWLVLLAVVLYGVFVLFLAHMLLR